MLIVFHCSLVFTLTKYLLTTYSVLKVDINASKSVYNSDTYETYGFGKAIHIIKYHTIGNIAVISDMKEYCILLRGEENKGLRN